MKKVFFALAVVAMFSFVACNGNNTEATDTLNEDTTCIQNDVNNDENIDSTVVMDNVDENTENETEQQN
ncbi:MAG: hypothetical protein J6X58_01200 [Bacteroidales bacterium]|nr:hypothetical protein [Bacteroidales bacterium]